MREVRVIVAGSRTYSDADRIFSCLDKAFEEIKSKMQEPCEFTIVSGGCRGVDMVGEQYAKTHGLGLARFPAQWDKYGRGAGPIRNEEMLEFASEKDKVPYLIAFWDYKSSGPRGIIALARNKRIPVRIEKIVSGM